MRVSQVIRQLKGFKEGLQENNIIAVFVLVFSFGAQFMFFGLSISHDWDAWLNRHGASFGILGIVLGLAMMLFSLWLLASLGVRRGK